MIPNRKVGILDKFNNEKEYAKKISNYLKEYMMDEENHMYTKDELKKILDSMSQERINKLFKL